jgi:hypothetical protein
MPTTWCRMRSSDQMSTGVGVQEALVRFLQQTTLKREIDEVQQQPAALPSPSGIIRMRPGERE